jgi:hypothetical protein
MGRWHTLVGVLALGAVVLSCGTVPTAPGTVPTTTPDAARPDDPDPVPDTEHAVALVTAWTQEATQAARNGPTVLVRFATGSRAPGLEADPDCVPPFAGALRTEPTALADAIVTAREDGTFRVRGSGLSVEVVVHGGRVGHLEACGGPTSLLAEAEQERLDALAAAEAEAARQAAAEAAELEEQERARAAAERQAQADAAEAAPEDGTDDGTDGTDEGEAVPDRVEVFPGDRTTGTSG